MQVMHAYRETQNPEVRYRTNMTPDWGRYIHRFTEKSTLKGDNQEQMGSSGANVVNNIFVQYSSFMMVVYK